MSHYIRKIKSEAKIIESWRSDVIQVSILCMVFNHEAFLESAIIGFLSQDADFPFEVIINDDCSTDRSREIIQRYALLYPNIIKVIYHDENMFSQGIRPINYLLPKAKGKYICICEGDDYWIDAHKISAHVEFFRSNPDFSLHVFDAYEEDNVGLDRESSKLNRLKIRSGSYSELEMKTRHVLLPLTSCFKNNFQLPFPRYFNKSINGDTLLNLKLSNIGKAYVDNTRKVAVYRHHEGGIWSSINREKKYYEYMHNLLVHSQSLAEDDFIGVSHDKLITMIMETIRYIGVKKVFMVLILKLFRRLNVCNEKDGM
ncbi:glycosyltransferase family 2 protein [Aliivibrio fischeri]|uniref:glycosyltransferase family 2 protein n=1 Tax=Aliivibrio fischeri TaxID=668 RepID=UPI001F1A9E1A|nr:glycosyltransferase family A protein [Aliivibrio fischeri]MCE4935498.1 glycosyltransferase family 2 protein [Aliivibrio fischeri]